MASAAGQIDIAWGDCVLAGTLNDAFACNTNSGASLMYASFRPPFTMGKFNGHAGVVDIQVAAAALDPWWQLATGGCRNPTAVVTDDRLTVGFDFTGGPFSCLDPWNGGAGGGSDISITAPNRLRLRTVCAISAPESLYDVDIDGNPVEFYVFKATLSHAQTVGAAPCAGCTDPACIVFNSMKGTQPAGVGDFVLTTGPQQYITWRGGAIGGLGCPAATPTQKATWGSVKALYR
jgi:hypothetical protein